MLPSLAKSRVVWPKPRLELTPREKEALEAWYQLWTPSLQKKFGAVYRFNHEFVGKLPLPRRHAGATRTLEIGGGSGDHLTFEDLSRQEYHVLELREAFAAHVRGRLPDDQVRVGDIEQGAPWPDGYFDRVVAIHVLEHLCNLPAALAEVKRLLSPTGVFDVVLPCEAGLAYTLARAVSTKRSFERRFDVSYDRIIKSEHVSTYAEVETELLRVFEPVSTRYFPLRVPSPHLNICVGLRLRARR